MNEFALRLGRPSRGILAAAGAAVKFLVVPLLLIYALITLLKEAGGEEYVGVLGLDALVQTVVVLGIAITALSFFRGFYPKGSLSRMAFGLAAMAATGAWVWVIARGGELVLDVDQLGLEVGFTGLLLLFLAVVALRALFYVVEMRSYRQEWLASLAAPIQPEAAPASPPPTVENPEERQI